jgi:hypothetical protein
MGKLLAMRPAAIRRAGKRAQKPSNALFPLEKL